MTLGSMTGLMAVLLLAVRQVSCGAEATGALRVHPDNARYFTDGTRRADGSLRAVYLTGSHTWANLIDRGPSDPPPAFDFSKYLDLLEASNHNFIRLWARQVTHYHGYGGEELHATPLPWKRAGPGNALDGKPKFDLTKFEETYFDRLRERTKAAGVRGIYVGVMLFGGHYECEGGWKGNPFHAENNINQINGDPEGKGNGRASHTLEIPEIVRLQENYIRKVLKAVSDLNNVLYEISNEGGSESLPWQEHWVRFIQKEDSQHPVGITALYLDDSGQNNSLLPKTPADWIAPFYDGKTIKSLPPAQGTKVQILDSDHWFVKELYRNAIFGRDWVWKAFCHGYNPILMEHLPPLSFVDPDYPLSLEDAGYRASRLAMGSTRKFADQMELAKMIPQPGLSSTKFCLAAKGKEYLVYQPTLGKEFSVLMQEGKYQFQWFDIEANEATRRGEIRTENGQMKFQPEKQEGVILLRSLQGR